MAKSKLEQRVDRLSRLVMWTMLVVAGLCLVAIAKQTNEKAAQAAPVADALAIASLKDYAGLEAERMAKMASALMGLGGLYDADCSASYWPHDDDKVAISYTITWMRGKQGEPDMTQITWYGASWGECIAKMLAWKQGGE